MIESKYDVLKAMFKLSDSNARASERFCVLDRGDHFTVIPLVHDSKMEEWSQAYRDGKADDKKTSFRLQEFYDEDKKNYCIVNLDDNQRTCIEWAIRQKSVVLAESQLKVAANDYVHFTVLYCSFGFYLIYIQRAGIVVCKESDTSCLSELLELLVMFGPEASECELKSLISSADAETVVSTLKDKLSESDLQEVQKALAESVRQC